MDDNNTPPSGTTKGHTMTKQAQTVDAQKVRNAFTRLSEVVAKWDRLLNFGQHGKVLFDASCWLAENRHSASGATECGEGFHLQNKWREAMGELHSFNLALVALVDEDHGHDRVEAALANLRRIIETTV